MIAFRSNCMASDEEYEKVAKSMFFELNPNYINEELSWSIKSTVMWDTKEEAQEFIDYLLKTRFK